MKEVEISIVQNYWHNNEGHYHPFLAVKLTNNSFKELNNAKIGAVFYQKKSKEIWDEDKSDIISSSSSSLKKDIAKHVF